jgi:hypothetical protein
MVLTKEQKEDLLLRLKAGKEKKRMDKEQLEKEQSQKVMPEPVEDVEEPIVKSDPIPIPKRVIKPTPKINLDSEEEQEEYYTNKKTIRNNESNNKYYNKERGQPIMKIKLYKDTPETQNIMKSILNNEKLSRHQEPKDEEPKKESINIKNNINVKTKEQLKKEYLDNLSKSFF